MAKDIFVVVEQRVDENGVCVVQKVGIELIGEACKLAKDSGDNVVAVLLGHNFTDQAQMLIQYGASKVLVVDSEYLVPFMTEPYVKAVTQIVRDYEPSIVLFGASSIGRDIAPRVAGRVHTGLTADCTRLDIDVAKYQDFLRRTTSLQPEKIDALSSPEMAARLDPKLLKMTRPAFGGNIMATIVCPAYAPQMATVRPGVMEMPEKNPNAKGIVEEVKVDFVPEDRNVEILSTEHPKEKIVDITDAKVLVSGGRGVGGPEGFDLLRPLAKELGGEVSSSRIGVDNGWIEKSRQVGQTGKTVHPNLYLACGISGAIQHQAGMESSECIIAINKDDKCPMMEMADLGIQADLFKIVPKLTAAVKAYNEKKNQL